MVNIAICDDDSIILSKFESKLQLFFQLFNIKATIHLFIDSKSFIDSCKTTIFDLVFLDIRMPDMDGFEVAHILQNNEHQTNIIFFTSVTDFYIAQNAFLYKPIAFIKKESIDEDLEKYKKSILTALQNNTSYYVYTVNNQTQKIKICDIYYFESKRNYINIYTVTDIKPIELKKTLKSVLEEINNASMIQIHKGIIVNITHVDRIDKNFAYLTNKKFVSIGRQFYKNLEDKFKQYIGE